MDSPPSVDCHYPWFAALRQNLAIPHPTLLYLDIDWRLVGDSAVKGGRDPSPNFRGHLRVVSRMTCVYVPASTTSVRWASLGKNRRRLTTAAGGRTGVGNGGIVKFHLIWCI